MNSDFLIKLNNLWTDHRVELNSGLTETKINLFEKEINYSFDNNYKEFLKLCNGFKDFDSDENMLSFWSVERIKVEIPDHPTNVIWFSDYCINLCNFGFHKTDDKIYAHYQHKKDINCIADTFEDFINLYLKDFSLLLP